MVIRECYMEQEKKYQNPLKCPPCFQWHSHGKTEEIFLINICKTAPWTLIYSFAKHHRTDLQASQKLQTVISGSCQMILPLDTKCYSFRMQEARGKNHLPVKFLYFFSVQTSYWIRAAVLLHLMEVTKMLKMLLY